MNTTNKQFSNAAFKNKKKEIVLSTSWCQFEISLTDRQQTKLIRGLAQSFLFSSGAAPGIRQVEGHFQNDRYNILSGLPETWEETDKSSRTVSKLQHPRRDAKNAEATPPETHHYLELPFICGYMGFASYEWGASQSLCDIRTLKSDLPSFYMGYYSWSYVFDRQKNTGWLTFSPSCPTEKREYVLALVEASRTSNETEPPYNVGEWIGEQSRHQYLDNFNRVKNYLFSGDCYQINLAQRFGAEFTGDSISLFTQLQENIHTPYSCLVNFAPDKQILSFSPEQFLRIERDHVVTRPIKGTIRRDDNEPENSTILQNSSKDKAENLMIVDLLRNDLSKVCQLHSVKVDKLFELCTYPNVHHLVSTVSGILKKDISPLDAFLSCFPGGSITGAPKIRAMEIINELEPSGRDAYCGSVFYWSDQDVFDSNILIRTIVRDGGRLHCWGGGGIVVESEANAEYQESITKIENLMLLSRKQQKLT